MSVATFRRAREVERSPEYAMAGGMLERVGAKGISYFAEVLARAGFLSDEVRSTREMAMLRCAGKQCALSGLQEYWYEQLRGSRRADFSVYDDERYVAETYACWSTYSRKYLRACAIPSRMFRDGLMSEMAAQSVIDLGCGHGFTTAALRELLPSASVIGTNRPESRQWKVAEVLAHDYGFTLTPQRPDRHADLVFASEYFEHFHEPIVHLAEILDATTPSMLLVANAFGSEAIGHFDSYIVGRELVNGRATSNAFSKTLRARGYRKVETGFWNARPSYWVKN